MTPATCNPATSRSGSPTCSSEMSALPSASGRLGRKLDLLVPAFGIPGGKLVEHPRARDLVGPYLAAGSYVTIVMVPLMEAALERARALESTDDVAAGLVG